VGKGHDRSRKSNKSTNIKLKFIVSLTRIKKKRITVNKEGRRSINEIKVRS
jgi:hypothetical protein